MKLFLLALILLLAFNANAFQNEPQLADRDQEQRAESLFKNIRCMVCQGESLAESNADLAIGMRKLIRDQISQGKSDEDIKSYLSVRYGQQILQEPPFEKQTYLLWLLPLIIFCIGAFIILKFTRFKHILKHEN